VAACDICGLTQKPLHLSGFKATFGDVEKGQCISYISQGRAALSTVSRAMRARARRS
jgi:hypothetical protein